jgi:hypothetical protein
MADWYVSSAAYAAVPAWQATHAYTVGQFVRPTAGAIGTSWVYRCTTAGTSSGTEPVWGTVAGANNDPFTDGTAGFTNVTGQSAYGWSAAAGTLYTLTGGNARVRLTTPTERVFLSSDHSESSVSPGSSYTQNNGGFIAFGLTQFISVNRAGSVPPVAADVQSGASITVTGASLVIDACTEVFWQGITFTVAGGATNYNLYFCGGSTGYKQHYFKNCALVISNTNVNSRMGPNGTAPKVVFDNTTVQFGNASQSITVGFSIEYIWINTPSAIQGATLPTSLFTTSSNTFLLVTARGVDFSALTGSFVTGSTVSGGTPYKILLDSCRINSALNRAGTNVALVSDEIELVNCFDGTNVLNERYTPAGVVITDRSTTLSGGAQDDAGAYSIKLVSSTRSEKQVMLLDSFWLDVENALVGSARTATVEIISSASLNNDDIRLFLEYMGTGGSAVASFADSLASVLTASAALTTSANTWNNPPSTPVKQLLQMTFTPQAAGRVRGLVRLGKVSATVWVNPQLTIT